jgi:hypothetical protein
MKHPRASTTFSKPFASSDLPTKTIDTSDAGRGIKKVSLDKYLHDDGQTYYDYYSNLLLNKIQSNTASRTTSHVYKKEWFQSGCRSL